MAPPETTRSAPKHPETEGEFERILDRYPRVLVEFYADWCHPCEQIDPVIEEVAVSTDFPVLKIEVERHPAIAAKYDVDAVPTTILFDDGDPIERRVGQQSESELRELASSR